MGTTEMNDLPYIPIGTRCLVALEYLGILDFIPSFSVGANAKVTVQIKS